MRHLNYNHPYYFWRVAKEGSIARASELLYLTPQTVSGQTRFLNEFKDSALAKAFGQAGARVFAAPSAIGEEVKRHYDAKVIGRTDKVRERFYAISAERRIKHPAVVAISRAARESLFKNAS
nr:hypothetical protein [Gammaproteobacteria bacterium]